MIWKKEFDIEDMKPFTENTLVGHLGIEFLEKGEDFLTAAMFMRREAAVRRVADDRRRASHFAADPVEHHALDAGCR